MGYTRGVIRGHARRLVAGVSLVGLLAASGAVGTAASSSPKRATLRLVDTQPLTLAGTGFPARKGQRVRVRVMAQIDGQTPFESVTARRSGTFTAVFVQDVVLDRCNSDLVARASGGGRIAMLKMQPTYCPPALGGGPAP